MKIDELNQQAMATYVASVRNEKQQETTDSQSEVAVKQQRATDKVELSVASQAKEQQEAKPSRVEELKAQIANGTYNVPALAVAEKMMSNMEMSNNTMSKGMMSPRMMSTAS